MFGVLMTDPWKPTSLQPRSSTRMNRMCGGLEFLDGCDKTRPIKKTVTRTKTVRKRRTSILGYGVETRVSHDIHMKRLLIVFIIWPVWPRARFHWLLRKFPYEGRTRWQGRKKLHGPARTALRDANSKQFVVVTILTFSSNEYFRQRILLPWRTDRWGTSSTANIFLTSCSFSLNENFYLCILSKLSRLLNFESFAIGIVQK